MHSTHDGHVQRAGYQNRYALSPADETFAPDAWIAAAVGAATLGELESIVADAKTAGAFGPGDLVWARALWAAFGSGGHWAAIALVRRELGGVEVAS